MMERLNFSLASAEDTTALGRCLAEHARTGDVISLEGNLGSGKTTLSQGYIRQLAGQDAEVNSPTFNLVHPYDTPLGKVWHFDLYRLKHKDELVELGIEDALQYGLCLIEWPAIAAELLPPARLEVVLTHHEGGRNATLTAHGAWKERLKETWFTPLKSHLRT